MINEMTIPRVFAALGSIYLYYKMIQMVMPTSSAKFKKKQDV
jgi:hypothetical protein